MKLKLFLLSILALLSVVAYQKYTEYSSLKSINSYESCVAANGSLIQESYPATCITRLGNKFNEFNITPWEEVEKYIFNGEVKIIAESHSKIISLLLKSGKWVYSFEPESSALSNIRFRCGSKCDDMLMRNE